jgi:mono/diheme cytochrome c family protein
MTRPRTHRTLLLLAAALAGAVTLSVRPDAAAVARPADKDAAGARAAFLEVYKVLMHPRCMNCHPSGDSPLQGDDSHVHMQNVKRGEDGKGKYALKCANCHQDANLPGANMPPGNPTWHLPTKKMPLVFQGKSPRELADQLKDPRQNGGKTLEQLVEHVTHDKLVLWAWQPGDGRTKPPLAHEQFVMKLREWVEKGAASPK